MGLHPAIEVKSFDTYGFPCKGLFVKSNHRINKGEHVWWWGDDDPLRTFTKQEMLTAPTTPTSLDDLASIGTCNEFILKSSVIVENPRATVLTYSYMLDDDCFAATFYLEEDTSYSFNHTCDPNTGYRGDELVVALRDIEAGEQIGYDYGFTETEESAHCGLECKCGSPKCRGVLDFTNYKDPIFVREHYENCTDFIKRKMKECAGA